MIGLDENIHSSTLFMHDKVIPIGDSLTSISYSSKIVEGFSLYSNIIFTYDKVFFKEDSSGFYDVWQIVPYLCA